jgi:signal transduction histidine kinase
MLDGAASPAVESVTWRPDGLESIAPSHLGAMTVQELHEPLLAVQSLLSVVLHSKAGPLTPLQADFLSTAKRASQRLERQVENLKIAASVGQAIALQPALLDLDERIRLCSQELSPVAAQHRVQLVPTNDLSITVRNIRADPRRVDQILHNLVEVAINSAQPESDIHISASRGPNGSAAVVIESALARHRSRDLEYWFQPLFEDVPSAACDRLGLGLAISAHLVRSHGGDMMAAIRNRYLRLGFILPRFPVKRETDPVGRGA